MQPIQSGKIAVGHPVDVASGNLFHEFEDYVLTGRMPLVFGRRYSGSLVGSPDGIFGPGWSSPFEMRFRRDLDGFQVVLEDGETRLNFTGSDTDLEAGGVLRLPGAFHELRLERGKYVLTRWDPDTDEIVRYLFPRGRGGDWCLLAAREDADGQGIDLERDAAGQLTFLRQRREGRGYRLTYDRAGRVTQVHFVPAPTLPRDKQQRPDPAARMLLRYSYDSDGRLCEFQNALGHTGQYAYDDLGRMTREVTLGGMVYTFRYDDRGRCVETAGHGSFGLTTLSYDETTRTTRVTNSLDEVTVYRWNESGQVEQVASPLGHLRVSAYDGFGRITASVNPAGAATSYVYDERGDRVKLLLPGGAAWSYEFDDQHRLLATIDPAGSCWRRTYGPHGLSVETSPLGATWTKKYNVRGDLIQIVNPAGQQRSFTWDDAGNVASATDWLGNTARYEYTAEGQLRAEVDALGRRTEVQYDPLGRVSQLRLPDGHTRKYVWNAYDQVTQQINEHGGITRRNFTGCGLLTHVEYPDGSRITLTWGTEPGQLLSILNALGERYLFAYDADGRLQKETDFAGRTTRYEHTPDGRVSVLENALGQRTEFAYDEAGRLTKIVRPDGKQITGAYDLRGLLVKADNGDCALERTYDEVGQLLFEKQGEHWVRNEYDRTGSRVRRTSSLGAETAFEWNDNGQLTRLKPAGLLPIQFEYDACRNEISRSVPQGMRITRSYDQRRRCVEQRVVPSDTRPWTQGGNWPVQRQYDYSPVGDLTAVLDGQWGQCTASYDPLSRIVGARLTSILAEEFSYDSADNVTTLTRQPLGSQGPAPGLATGIQKCNYAAGSILTERDGVRCEYDALGQLVLKSDGRGTTHYSWDSDGKLARVELPNGAEWTYTYDPLGRRVAKSGPTGRTEFIWDDDVVLHEHRSYGTSEAEVIHWEFEPETFAPLFKIEKGKPYFSVNDVAGLPRELVTSEGTVVWRALYSSFGEIVAERAADTSCPVRYQGQWYDEETGFHYNRFRYYDPAVSRYVSPDPEGVSAGLNAFTYAPNTSGWIDPFGLTSSCPTWNEFQKRNKGKFKSRQEAATAWLAYRQANHSANDLSIGRLPDTQAAQAQGRQILSLPTGWTPAVNDAWVQGGIDRGATFRMESPPTNANRSHPVYGQSVYGRELSQLEAAGYKPRSPRSIFMDPP